MAKNSRGNRGKSSQSAADTNVKGKPEQMQQDDNKNFRTSNDDLTGARAREEFDTDDEMNAKVRDARTDKSSTRAQGGSITDDFRVAAQRNLDIYKVEIDRLTDEVISKASRDYGDRIARLEEKHTTIQEDIERLGSAADNEIEYLKTNIRQKLNDLRDNIQDVAQESA